MIFRLIKIIKIHDSKVRSINPVHDEYLSSGFKTFQFQKRRILFAVIFFYRLLIESVTN